jgi:hypothetical protein
MLQVSPKAWGSRVRDHHSRVHQAARCSLHRQLLHGLDIIHHKVHIYIEYDNVYPLVGIGTLPTTHTQASVPLPPGTRGGGAHSPAGEGLGESQFRRIEKKLNTLSTLCNSRF